MGKLTISKFWLGAIALAFLFSITGFSRTAQASCDSVCYCYATCCSYFNILTNVRQASGDDDDGIIDPVWECVSCLSPTEFCVPREPGEAVASLDYKPAQDSDGDMICDHCDNCKDTPNGLIEVNDEDECQRIDNICGDLFPKQEDPLQSAGLECTIVDQEDSNLDGVGDACE